MLANLTVGNDTNARRAVAAGAVEIAAAIMLEAAASAFLQKASAECIQCKRPAL